IVLRDRPSPTAPLVGAEISPGFASAPLSRFKAQPRDEVPGAGRLDLNIINPLACDQNVRRIPQVDLRQFFGGLLLNLLVVPPLLIAGCCPLGLFDPAVHFGIAVPAAVSAASISQ